MREAELAKLVRPLYSNKDSMHNFSHILRIKRKVKQYRVDYDVDEDKLNFIIYFHGSVKYVKDHKLDFPKSYFTSLYRHSKKPIEIEEKLVHDANLIASVGKEGIRKAMQVGKEIGRSKADTIKYIKNQLPKVKFYTKLGKKEGAEKLKEMKENLNNL